MKNILYFLIAFGSPLLAQDSSFAVKGGTAHIGNGTVINNSVIVVKAGKLEYVGTEDSKISGGIKIIDATGKHVYPGLIATNLTIGLNEISAVRSTIDFAEVGAYNPNVRALIAYNTDSKIIPTIRTNGILTAQVTPRGGVFSGTSSVVSLDGWNWEDAAYKMDEGVHLNWPRMYAPAYWTEDGPGPIEKTKSYEKDVNDIKKFMDDAMAYNNGKVEEANLRFAAMKGIFSGAQILYIHANLAKEIMASIGLVKLYGIKNLVIVGGTESWMVTDLLKQNNVSVIIGNVHDLPRKVDDDIDQPFKLAYLLKTAGINYCLANEGEMEVIGARNLSFQAGTTAAYGLSKEEALMSITINAAKILGIDKTTGSLENGKDATLFISTGDALDMRTNNVEAAFIKGVSVDLDNDQKALYRKYKQKYGLKN